MYKKALLALTVLLLLFFSVNLVFSAGDFFKGLAMINDVHTMIREYYVDPDVLQEKELPYQAIKGMLDALDPHSTFFTPEESRDMLTDIEGSFGGLGIRIDKKGDNIVVVSPIEGTPAYRLGLSAGDIIVEVDGETTSGESLEKVISRLRGEIGTKVRVGIRRENVSDILYFDIIRAKIELPSLSGSFMLDKKTGYIRFIHFQENSPDEMKKALKQLKEQGMKNLVLDLRYNPGGILDVAYEICDLFIPRGKVIVSTRGRDHSLIDEYISTEETPYEDIDLAILVDRGSASASEIMAGAVKDLKRGVIIGETTFGKGSVQRIYSLKDGSALKLTVAHYYTPGGLCVDGSGIEPDLSVESQALPYQLADLLRGGYIEDFAVSQEGSPDLPDEQLVREFRTFLKKIQYDFQGRFIGNGVNGDLIIEHVADWEGKVFQALTPELARQIRYRMLYHGQGEEKARFFMAQGDPAVARAIEWFSRNGEK
jgi:carboxyl-terminal processing protease